MLKIPDSLHYIVPFIGILLSISFGPLFLSKIWHRLENKILIFWSILVTFMMINLWGFKLSIEQIRHVMLTEYISFMSIIFAVFTVNGGFYLRIHGQATPLRNVILILIASFSSNFIGTTGTSILFLSTLISFNKNRKYQSHNIIFFIIAVANLGGCLSPLGDPPLFIGYINGIDFFWPTKNLFIHFILSMFYIGVVYYAIDCFFWKKEKSDNTNETNLSSLPNLSILPYKPITDSKKITFEFKGKRNIIFLIAVMITVLLPSYLPKKVISFLGDRINLSNTLRDGLLIIIGISSYLFGSKKIRKLQNFSYAPVKEISGVFFAIFVSIIPVSIMLKAGTEGPFKEALSCCNTPSSFFWLTGVFSAFLDNAPTYMVFFNINGGDANYLMTTGTKTLKAISLGAVFMGALTYIGNGPNLIVRSLAKQNGIKMPSFMLYFFISLVILLPLFLFLDFVFLK